MFPQENICLNGRVIMNRNGNCATSLELRRLTDRSKLITHLEKLGALIRSGARGKI